MFFNIHQCLNDWDIINYSRMKRHQCIRKLLRLNNILCCNVRIQSKSPWTYELLSIVIPNSLMTSSSLLLTILLIVDSSKSFHRTFIKTIKCFKPIFFSSKTAVYPQINSFASKRLMILQVFCFEKPHTSQSSLYSYSQFFTSSERTFFSSKPIWSLLLLDIFSLPLSTLT